MSTWYVRPDTTHSGTRNGLTYATAWGGWAEIQWGAGKLTAGDILYVCGAHSYSTNIAVGNHLGTANNRCTISGGYAPSPGSIAFTGSYYLQNDYSGGTFINLAVPSILHENSASNCTYQTCQFNTPGNQNGINISGADGTNYSDILIDDCDFTSNGTVTSSSAIKWFVSTGTASTLTRLTVSNSRFTNFNASRSIVQLRSQTDSAPATRMQDIVGHDLVFTNCTGECWEATNPGNPQAYGNSAGIKTYNFTFNNVTEALIAPFTGGCIGLWGFAPSQTPGFGPNVNYGHIVNTSIGPTGFVDMFYGSYIVQDNVVYNLSTSSIDGNGILFDLGSTNCLVRRNHFENITGKSGITNSGVGIMTLNDCNGNTAYANTFNNVRIGIFYGASGASSSGNYHNNSYQNITVEAVHTTSAATIMSQQSLKNNIFGGAGYQVNQAVGTTWANEDFNYYYGFINGSLNHTLGTNSVVGAVGDISSVMLMDPITYNLGAGSPGIGAGTFSGYANDYSNIPFKIPCAVGAQENKNLLPRAPRV